MKFYTLNFRIVRFKVTDELCKEHIEQKTELKVTIPKKEAGKSAKQSIVELEYRIKDLAEIMKYTEQYKANRSYYIGYKKSKNPNAYFRRYESQIILYGGCQTYA